VNYDPANLFHYGVEGTVRGVREMGKRIVHTHSKDQGYSSWLALEDETGIDVINSLKKGRNFSAVSDSLTGR